MSSGATGTEWGWEGGDPQCIILLFRGRPGPRAERRKAGLEMFEKGGFQIHLSVPGSNPMGGDGYEKFTSWDDVWRLPW